MVENKNKELVQTWLPTKIRVCIDYRKLNVVTHKDHFSLPFNYQILERLVGYVYYCFLDGYSGYNRILIALEDQEKTIFICSFGTFACRRMSFGLCNAPATFQRYMFSLFSDMVNGSLKSLWMISPSMEIHSLIFSPSRTRSPTMWWKELNTKLENMPLHGKTGNRLGIWNLKKRDWSG